MKVDDSLELGDVVGDCGADEESSHERGHAEGKAKSDGRAVFCHRVRTPGVGVWIERLGWFMR